jgi:hypothetical protein
VGQGSTLALGDPMVLLTAISRAEKSPDLPEFCSSVGLRLKGVIIILVRILQRFPSPYTQF